MTVKRLKSTAVVRRTPCGVTLVEVMVAMVVLAVAALGALGYQYFAARHARIAKAQVTATRTAQLLLEDWKSTGGNDKYDPTTLGLGFSTPDDGSEANFFVNADDLPMYIEMSQSSVHQDDDAGIALWQLTVTVRWRGDYTNNAPRADDPSLVLTTYVRRDASGG